MGGILRDAALYALVAFGLCVPLVAYRMDPGPGSDLVLVPRWGLVAILCAVTFGLRLLQRLLLLRRDARRALAPSPPRRPRRWGPSPMPGRRCRRSAFGCSWRSQPLCPSWRPWPRGISAPPATGSTSGS
ncbi:DUF3382 domain-containing protein [Methylobacterium persicinum]